MKILIPAAGEGSRFRDAGYTFPKPLIDVDGKPMISRVVENFRDLDADFIFLVRQEHIERYSLDSILDHATDGRFAIVAVEGLTEGAACTALLAEDLIDRDEELIIANSDQLMKFSAFNFQMLIDRSDLDAAVFCFNSTHPKWSFVKTDAMGTVTECAEKNPISDIATCGVYYYRRGSDFVKYAHQMIDQDIRVNGEFYICPVYNELIEDGGTLIPFMVDRMYGLGTPEDLDRYLAEKRV